MRHYLAIAALALLAGCQSAPAVPDMPDAPDIVHVKTTEYVVPEWLVKPLPEDKPKANTTEEATRLSCARLYTIQAANCRAALGRRLAKGKAVTTDDILACEAKAARECKGH